MLSLGGLGIAAAATIVAFFGIGLSLLIKPPAGLIRSAPTAAAVGDRASSTTPPAATARREPPALRDGPLPPPHNEASAPPTLAGQPPAGVPVPLAAPSRTASATPAPPIPSPLPDRAATPMPAVHDAAAPPAPAAPTQPPRVETSPLRIGGRDAATRRHAARAARGAREDPGRRERAGDKLASVHSRNRNPPDPGRRHLSSRRPELGAALLSACLCGRRGTRSVGDRSQLRSVFPATFSFVDATWRPG